MKILQRHYLILLLLGLVFTAPGIAAYFYYTHPQMLGGTMTNKGILLQPPVKLVSLQKEPPKWKLVLWSSTTCEKTCIEQIDKLARVRLALGRHVYDVVPQVLLGADASPLSDQLMKTLQDRDIHVLTLPVSVYQHISVLQNPLAIFIASPDDYLVFAYQPTVKPGDIFHDIKQLLNTTTKVTTEAPSSRMSS